MPNTEEKNHVSTPTTERRKVFVNAQISATTRDTIKRLVARSDSRDGLVVQDAVRLLDIVLDSESLTDPELVTAVTALKYQYGR